ncbi:MAG: GFA family protein [Lacunisphaera sp.]
MAKCHCRDCQRTSGGPYSPAVVVPISAFRVTKGTIQHFETPSLAGGHNLRGFCAKCGSRLTGGESSEEGIIGLFASSLDDPSWFRPSVELFVADAQPWDPLDPRLPKYPENKPSP